MANGLTIKERERLAALLRKRGTTKKSRLKIPTVAEGVGIVIGGSMVLGPNAITAISQGQPRQALVNFQAYAKNNKRTIAMGLGIMAAPTIVRRLLGLRRNSTELVQLGPVKVSAI